MRPSRLVPLSLGPALALALLAGCGGKSGSSIGPTSPTTLQSASLAASPTDIRPGGTSTITVTTLGRGGQPSPGNAVTLTTTLGTLDPSAGQTGADGTFRATLRTSPAERGAAFVRATVSGLLTVETAVFLR